MCLGARISRQRSFSGANRLRFPISEMGCPAWVLARTVIQDERHSLPNISRISSLRRSIGCCGHWLCWHERLLAATEPGFSLMVHLPITRCTQFRKKSKTSKSVVDFPITPDSLCVQIVLCGIGSERWAGRGESKTSVVCQGSCDGAGLSPELDGELPSKIGLLTGLKGDSRCCVMD